MTFGTAAELDFMLKDAGVAVTYAGGSQTTYGILDRDPLQMLDGSGVLTIVGHKTYLTIRDGSLTGLAVDTAIVVGSVTFTIREVGFPDDDGTRRLELVDP